VEPWKRVLNTLFKDSQLSQFADAGKPQMELQVSIIDGKLIPERYRSAKALSNTEKEILAVWGRRRI
jgi:hypothetical protein